MRYDEAAEVWVSWCPALDVRSQGTTEQRAREAIEDALGMYLRYCYQKGILGKILTKRGFVTCKDEEAVNDDAFDEFVSVRAVHDQPKRAASIFDVTVPIPLVSNLPLVSEGMTAAA
jgi:hypothetical protein